MPRSGGEADKLGNHYESVWTVQAMLDVFLGKYRAITVEALDENSKGVEFHLERLDGGLEFHSVKRQKQGGDWSPADLCRINPATGRSILGDLFAKRRKHENVHLRFVSSTGANKLKELAERSAPLSYVNDFKRVISGTLLAEFEQRITPLCGHDENDAFRALKSLEVILRSHLDLIRGVDQRIDELLYRIDASELRPSDVRTSLAEYVLASLGSRLTTDDIREYLRSSGFGLRNWKVDPTIQETVRKTNDRYLSSIRIELINGAQIQRKETGQIIDEMTNPKSFGALLVAPGGYGKSCVLSQCVLELSRRNIPVLCLRMDSIKPCNTSKQLGLDMDLPASPAIVLAGVADNSPCVLIVDQLDAMSLVSGRNPALWDVFSELRDEIRPHPNMKMIVACRDFDLQHDHRLKSIGHATSGFKTVILTKLTQPEIESTLHAANLDDLKLSERQFGILGVPFHLLLFLQGNPKEQFGSESQLYDRYWDRKRRNVRDRIGQESYWTETVNTLAFEMSNNQLLFASKTIVDRWADTVEAMISEHVLVETPDRDQLRFFHESFFDYAYARRFCATGQNVADFLRSDEQHLFRRAQVRQILAYRREHDLAKYIADLRELFNSPQVRFHIKRMVASGLNQISEPKPEEWSVVEPLLLEGDLSRSISQALRRHVGWFDLLDRLGLFDTWLASDDDRLNNAAIWFFETPDIQEHRSARIADLVAPCMDKGAGWRDRLLRVMSWGKSHLSEEMAKLDLDLVRRGFYDGVKRTKYGQDDFWHQYYDAAKSAPKFMIDLSVAWFERAIERFDDGKTPYFLRECEQNKAHYGAQLIGQAARSEPEYFVAQVLPIVVTSVLRTELQTDDAVLNRIWVRLSNHGDPFDIDDALLFHLRNALQWIAKNNVAKMREHARIFASYPHETFAYLLLQSWAENPEEFADECAAYIAADRRRLDIGYSSWSGDGSGECAITRLALRAITPHCSPELLLQLEQLIFGVYDNYERMVPRWRGARELLLLRSFVQSRISDRTKLRIEELERKFPDISDAIVPVRESSLISAVSSPISSDIAVRMNDDQWISAMQKYDGSTDRFRGGPIELSRLLAQFAQRERQRFAALSHRMPDSVNPMYFSAILDGSCSRYGAAADKEADEKEVAAIPTKVFVDVIKRLHSLPGRPCGSAIAGCAGKLSDRELPCDILDIVAYYATSDPDPEIDAWRPTDEHPGYHGGDPYDYGINTVRGQAARAIASLLFADGSRYSRLRTALQHLSEDPVIAVRTCALLANTSMLNFARDDAIDLFTKACQGCEPICGTYPFARFTHYAIHSHYTTIRPILRFALASSNSEAVENVSREIILADLAEVDIGTDALDVRKGTTTMRSTAASVYGHNLSHTDVGDTCAMRLEEFFDDDEESVRENVSRSLFNLSGERLLVLKDMIARYIESKSFGVDTDSVLHALEESNVELPDVICRAGERVLELIGDEGSNFGSHAAGAARYTSILIVRQYEQAIDSALKTKCLDLIDRMERFDYFGIGEELSKIDR